MELEGLFTKLNNVELEETAKVYGETYTLRILVSDVHWGIRREVLSGALSFETLQPIPQIGGRPEYIKAGTTVLFSAFQGMITEYLAVFANRTWSERSATRMNYVLTRGENVPGQIVFNCFVPTAAMEQFLTSNPHIKKGGSWKDLNFVGVNRAILRGTNIDDFDQTQRYDAHGNKSWIMIELLTEKMTLSISADGIVTFYTPIDKEQALDWVRTKIIPLLA